MQPTRRSHGPLTYPFIAFHGEVTPPWSSMLSPFRCLQLSVAAIAVLVMWGTALATPAAADASACGHRGHSRITHVVVIAFENHSYAQVLGRHAPRSYFKNDGGAVRVGDAVSRGTRPPQPAELPRRDQRPCDDYGRLHPQPRVPVVLAKHLLAARPAALADLGRIDARPLRCPKSRSVRASPRARGLLHAHPSRRLPARHAATPQATPSPRAAIHVGRAQPAARHA